jgi:hypothetical protein
MSNKSQRREQAIKREKRKKLIIGTVCVVVAVAIVVLLFNDPYRKQSQARVFTDGAQTVTMQNDGTFTAELLHDTTYSGTFLEVAIGDTTTIVLFEVDGEDVQGTITNDILTMPEEWDDGHGHTGPLKLSDAKPTSNPQSNQANEPPVQTDQNAHDCGCGDDCHCHKSAEECDCPEDDEANLEMSVQIDQDPHDCGCGAGCHCHKSAAECDCSKDD